MRQKIFLLSMGLLGLTTAKAGTKDPDPNFEKSKKSDLLGIVTQIESKKPLKDVTVTAYSASTTEKKGAIVLTDQLGNFSFDELRPGTYKFVFEKSGFKKVTKEKVVLKQDEGFQLNIEMMQNQGHEIIPSAFHFSDF